MTLALQIASLRKVYDSGFVALQDLSLSVPRGEVFALLGPNGAGKSTLINIACGIVRASGGTVQVEGFDTVREARQARARIGLVPQELPSDAFTTVQAGVAYSRGLFGHAPNPARIEAVLRSLSLWDQRRSPMKALSGGMKRRVLIAKALAHEPTLLFLDEPTAGVDVALRRDMWATIRQLREQGVTIILTTHYLEEAQALADRIGVLRRGELVLVRPTAEVMQELGGKRLTLQLQQPLVELPAGLADLALQRSADAMQLSCDCTPREGWPGIGPLLQRLAAHGIAVQDLQTAQRSLEDIVIDLVEETGA